MRLAGTLFTVLALLAVQAPWVVCACEDGGVTPQLLGLFGDEMLCECSEAHDHDHDHDGHAHHDTKCVHHHAHVHHSHDDGEDHGPAGHVAFRLPMGTMPAGLALEAAQITFAPLALLTESFETAPLDRITFALDERPPGDPVAPSVRTERLLL